MTQNQRNIRYSLLELAVVSKGSTPAQTFQHSLELAQKAEEWGYTRFWLAEHHNAISIASSAPAILIGHIAQGTQKIRVGSGGIMLPNHSPLVVAEQFGTLGALYPHRIDLGLGRAPGTDPDTAQAIRSDRMHSVLKFPEEISQIQQYFSPDNVDATVRAPVAEGVDVPLYVLGSSTDSAHLAAKKGLPYAFASHFAPSQLLEALDIYHREFQPSEVLQTPYAIAGLNVIIADTQQEAEKQATSLIQMFYGILTGQRDYLQEPVEMTRDLRTLWQHPSVQRMLKFTFIGTQETVRQQTEAFLAQTGVNELMVVSNLYHPQDRMYSYRLFSEVMQTINGQQAPLLNQPEQSAATKQSTLR